MTRVSRGYKSIIENPRLPFGLVTNFSVCYSENNRKIKLVSPLGLS